MDITATNTNTAAAAATTIKTPEAESETPTRIQPAKPLSFSNGVLKRHQPLSHHHLLHGGFNIKNSGSHHAVVVTYKECLKNHAASLGGHAVDGCGEFMPAPNVNLHDPTSLKCAACGCHRNFHRREPEEPLLAPPPNTTPALEYQPHHRHHPPPPQPLRHSGGHSSPSSPSPPPISSSYYPSAPHMLLALSGGGLSGPAAIDNNTPISAGGISTPGPNPNSRKRFRTKFTQDQKEKMLDFAERVGWKIQKRDEEMIQEFCNEVGVDRGVLKVWMHNNKNTLGKKQDHNSNIVATMPARDNINTAANGNGNGNGNGIGLGATAAGPDDSTARLYHHQQQFHHHQHDDSDNNNQSLNQPHQLHNSADSSVNDVVVATTTYGSSSSS